MSTVVFAEPGALPQKEVNRLRRQGIEVVTVTDVTKVSAYPAPPAPAPALASEDIESDGFRLDH
jgi:hypothetical protein